MSSPPTHESDSDNAALIAAQREFLTSESKPAAKVVRATSPRQTRPPRASTSAERQNDDDGLEWTHGPGWYQQMKGVRFRLDDLEDDDEDEEKVGATGRKGGRRKETPVDRDVRPAAGTVMGDIVERKTTTAVPTFSPRGSQGLIGGFPAPRKFGRPQQAKAQPAPPQGIPSWQDEESSGEMLQGKELMEEIDKENRKKMAEMSEEEILELQRSLQASLSPEFREMLLRKNKTSLPTSPTQASTSIKSSSTVPQTDPKSSTTTSLLPLKQISITTTAASKSKPTTKPTPNDPFTDDKSFDEHLRTFFPSSTTSVPPPEWTLPVHPAEETFYSTPDNTHPDPSTMRFDFQGKLIPPTTSRTLPTHLGLHHHSLDPGAAGYTLAELAILARSVQPSQKCIALKIIGFVLTDVAAGKYPWDIQEGLWDEIEREKVIEILLEVAKGGREGGGNRSVQRYAEDAVTGWVNVGGPKQWEQRLQKKGFERVPDTEES